MLELENNFKKNGGRFGDFLISDIFTLKKGTRLTKAQMIKGSIPFIGASAQNNGKTGTVGNNTNLHSGNTISVSYNGSVGEAFYQPLSYWASDDINVLYPNFELTHRIALYIITALRKLGKSYGYGFKWHLKRMEKDSINLPVNDKDQLDLQFMEDYIRELEEDYIRELEEDYIRELDTYLKVAGLNDYELSDDELQILKNPPNYSSFKVNELFLVEQSKKKFNANSVKFGGSFPYVARGSSANGIRGYIDQNPVYLNEARTISFGQDTATAYYQDKEFFTGDKIKVFKAKEQELNEETGLFLVATLQKSFSLYSWGSSSFSQDALENEKISFPLNDNKEPDWNYMEAFIKAVKKLVIADFVKFKNEYIEKSKQAIK
ncbi:restriction endonuclease subunit S [uncultured Turicimonas sp.]|uniref:restriction endonuclease subunit S n=1 Tax=uncultured Turicimonas sp. TaxID=1918607 RepID=UPI002804C6E8|nr:restriction endonuclease subunit S [uncultured Turicimonas sp.]